MAWQEANDASAYSTGLAWALPPASTSGSSTAIVCSRETSFTSVGPSRAPWGRKVTRALLDCSPMACALAAIAAVTDMTLTSWREKLETRSGFAYSTAMAYPMHRLLELSTPSAHVAVPGPVEP